MPKQKKTPTEAQLRKEARKELVEQIFGDWNRGQQDTPDGHFFAILTDVIKQRCPYTCVTVTIYKKIDGVPLVGESLGFSKCKWPDLFDSQHGIDLAVRKAISYIVKEHNLV